MFNFQHYDNWFLLLFELFLRISHWHNSSCWFNSYLAVQSVHLFLLQIKNNISKSFHLAHINFLFVLIKIQCLIKKPFFLVQSPEIYLCRDVFLFVERKNFFENSQAIEIIFRWENKTNRKWEKGLPFAIYWSNIKY